MPEQPDTDAEQQEDAEPDTRPTLQEAFDMTFGPDSADAPADDTPPDGPDESA